MGTDVTAAKPTTLGTALLAAQRAMPTITLDATNPHFKSRYASLPNILKAVNPVLNEHGLFLSQYATTIQDEHGMLPALRSRLTHAETGEFVEDTMLLMAQQNTPQGQGAALTYARRFAIVALLGLAADEDDDGHSASQPAQQRNGQQQEPGFQPPPGAAPDGPTKPQFAKLNATLADLDKQHKLPAGTWKDEAKLVCAERWGVDSTTKLTRAQMGELIDWATKELADAGLPF